MSFKPTGFSAEIFSKRYTLHDQETWEEACKRVAMQAALAETPDKILKYCDKFNEILNENLFCPGGRIWYGSGRPHPNLLNCFVLENELDSREAWGNIANEMIVTSMYGGGCGISFGDLRPKGAEIRGQKGEAPGPLELMKLINNCGDPIRSSGARRTALMFSLPITHPDIKTFLNAKLELNQLNLANISVEIHDMENFINCVKSDLPLELSWKGKYKSEQSATELWNMIVANSWKCAEPGLLNLDLMNKENTIYYLEDIVTVNPCGEINLTKHESCCLGHLVLPRFIKNGKIDFELLGDTIRTSVRFLDNILSVNNYPLEKMKIKANKYRRIGLGTTGLADTLILLGHRYGSKESLEFINDLYRFISKHAYSESIILAVEKGSFSSCDSELHINSGFVKRMPPKIRSMLREHGIRNCALLTQAPTGTISIISGNCSSGIEPVMAPAYERTFWSGEVQKTELVFHPLFLQFIKEGKDLSHFISAHQLEVEDHMKVQATIQRHVDNSISKTILMPEEYPIEKMAKVWLEYLPVLKGTTFYREGSRGKAPIKPFTIAEALEKYNQERENAKETMDEQQCRGGICEI